MRQETHVGPHMLATPFSWLVRAAEAGGERLAWESRCLDSRPTRLLHGAQFPNFCPQLPALSLTGWDLGQVTSPL